MILHENIIVFRSNKICKYELHENISTYQYYHGEGGWRKSCSCAILVHLSVNTMPSTKPATWQLIEGAVPVFGRSRVRTVDATCREGRCAVHHLGSETELCMVFVFASNS